MDRLNRPAPLRGARDALGFDVVWARHEDEVRQAQRLRYQVFAEEMGARLSVPQGSPAGHDIDMFDAYCEHLLVRTTGSAEEPGQVIGTYRVLTPAAARRVGSLYSGRRITVRMRYMGDKSTPIVRTTTVTAPNVGQDKLNKGSYHTRHQRHMHGFMGFMRRATRRRAQNMRRESAIRFQSAKRLVARFHETFRRFPCFPPRIQRLYAAGVIIGTI